MQTVDYDTQVYTDLRQYLKTLLNCPVVRGRQNNVPMPDDCVIMQNLFDNSPMQGYEVDGKLNEVVTRCIQLDFYGSMAGAKCRQIATLWKSEYSCSHLNFISPLYCNNPKSQQYVNEKGIYEDRYILEVFLQFSTYYEYNRESTDKLDIGVKSWR